MFVLKLEAHRLDAKLKEMLRRADDLSPAMQEAVDLTNESVLKEFTGSFYISPSGARKSWKEHVPFGTAKRRKLLWNRGRLAAAMMGGKGSRSKVSKRSFGYGIEKSMPFAYAHKNEEGGRGKSITLGEIVAIHRGGLGVVPNESQVTLVRAKEMTEGGNFSPDSPMAFKMYWKLRNAYGVRLSHQKMMSGLAIPARPFAAMNVPLKKAIVGAVKDYILSLPKRSRRR